MGRSWAERHRKGIIKATDFDGPERLKLLVIAKRFPEYAHLAVNEQTEGAPRYVVIATFSGS